MCSQDPGTLCFKFVLKVFAAYLIIFFAHNNTIHGTDTVQDDLVTHAADMTNPLHQDILQNGSLTIGNQPLTLKSFSQMGLSL